VFMVVCPAGFRDGERRGGTVMRPIFGILAIVVLSPMPAFALEGRETAETPEQCTERCGLWYMECVMNCPGIRDAVNGAGISEEEATGIIENDTCAMGCVPRARSCMSCDSASAAAFPRPADGVYARQLGIRKCQDACDDRYVEEAYGACRIEERLADVRDSDEFKRRMSELIDSDPCLGGYYRKIVTCKEACE